VRLPKVCRFGAQARCPYSVAQQEILVRDLWLPPGCPRWVANPGLAVPVLFEHEERADRRDELERIELAVGLEEPLDQ
jgi:hypothetical protein